MKKRFLASILLLALVATTLVGCTLFDFGKSEKTTSDRADNELSWSEL